jgi:uncharacterized membrane protein
MSPRVWRMVTKETLIARGPTVDMLAKVHLRVAFGNVIVQAGLLAVSLAALAYDQDVVPPWVAIILAVVGILLLAWTLMAGAYIRIQGENREIDQSNDPLPEGSSGDEDLTG